MSKNRSRKARSSSGPKGRRLNHNVGQTMPGKLSHQGADAQRSRLTERCAFAATCFLLSTLCLFPYLLSAQNANQPPTTPQATPAQPTPTQATPTRTPTPTPTPTPPSTLHQWGAVTLFHGLPSDRVRAIAQDADGAMWFGTDGGLAKYDGRRTQAITIEGLTSKRVMALKLDE